jgi:hypothetical protein
MYPRPQILLGILAVALLFLGKITPAVADGVRVERRVSLGELVKTSDAIFTAIIEASQPRWAEREAYGEKHRYVESHSFRVKVTGWLKGERKLPANVALWVGLRGDPPPGKWLLVPEEFDTTFSPHNAKPGDAIIVFAEDSHLGSWGSFQVDGKAILRPRAVDRGDRLPAVRRAMDKKERKGLL